MTAVDPLLPLAIPKPDVQIAVSGHPPRQLPV